MTHSDEASAQLRFALDTAPAGLLVITDSHVSLANSTAEQLFGYDSGNLIGLAVDQLITEPERLSPSPDAAAPSLLVETVGRCRDGREFPIEVRLTRDPAAAAMTAWVVDRTLRRQAEERFRVAVESSPSGMIMVDPAGAIVMVNRETERLLGYAREELIGKSIESLVPERYRGTHPGHRRSFHATPSSRPMGAGIELFARRKDGVEIPVEIGLNPIETPQGTFVLSSIVDIRARLALEAQVRESHKMEAIGTLAGGIAHDFNNILRAIVGFTELAREEVLTLPNVTSDLEHVLRAAERGRLMVERILTFSRRREAARERIDLDRTVSEALQFLRASLPSTIKIRRDFDSRTPHVIGDETELHQVIVNLATNSSQAMRDTGVLDVHLAPHRISPQSISPMGLPPGLYARLTVADTGEGMPPEVVARAFDPFFTTKPPGSGTGLGLSVVHGIVKRHGGAIEIRSHPGEGTAIHVYLPAADPVAAMESEPAKETPGSRGHVLFVEDEEVLLELGRRQLEREGYRVTGFTSSLQALEAFRSRPLAFDVLITDNTMPTMTGFALAQEALRIRPDLPVLMVSGLAEGLEERDVYSTGVRLVLRKPHTGTELVEALRTVLKTA